MVGRAGTGTWHQAKSGLAKPKLWAHQSAGGRLGAQPSVDCEMGGEGRFDAGGTLAWAWPSATWACPPPTLGGAK
jgi:hypothetical protein